MVSCYHPVRWIIAGVLGLAVLSPWLASTLQSADERNAGGTRESTKGTHDIRMISGWEVKISRKLLEKEPELTEKAMVLLKVQLEDVRKVVPPFALREIQKVPIWVSPEYPGQQPRAEYHPGAGWLRENGRDPAMAKAVEITDTKDFESECKRMPMLMLHELAHAYHDRVLGFDHPEIVAAYDRAKKSGKYDKVERRFANGNTRMERAYAMTNPQEYFAECSEAFFGVNDWYPYTLDQLKKHDPEVVPILEKLWKNPQGRKGKDLEE